MIGIAGNESAVAKYTQTQTTSAIAKASVLVSSCNNNQLCFTDIDPVTEMKDIAVEAHKNQQKSDGKYLGLLSYAIILCYKTIILLVLCYVQCVCFTGIDPVTALKYIAVEAHKNQQKSDGK